MSAGTVLGVDPGRRKCGLAVVRRESAGPPTVLHREVAPAEELAVRAAALWERFACDIAVVGDGTQSADSADALRQALPSCPVETVPEAFSSQRARRRFLEENPPRGWRRLVPIGLRVPDCPVDDYVAVLLAEEWFNRNITPV